MYKLFIKLNVGSDDSGALLFNVDVARDTEATTTQCGKTCVYVCVCVCVCVCLCVCWKVNGALNIKKCRG